MGGLYLRKITEFIAGGAAAVIFVAAVTLIMLAVQKRNNLERSIYNPGKEELLIYEKEVP